MNIQQSTNGPNPSNNLSCPHCHTQFPPQAVFCSSCGERVKKNGEDDAQEQDVDTVRLVSLSQTQLKHWQASRSLKNGIAPKQPHVNSPLSQDIEAPMLSPVEIEIPKTEPADARAQDRSQIPTELSQSLATIPVPSIYETRQEVPETDVPALKPPGSNWLWPTIIILSTIATGLVNFVITDTIVRPFIVLWFLCVCPGMALVRFLRLAERLVEWILVIALSFAVDAIVAGILLYTGRWSPTAILGILMGFSLGGAIMQLGFSVSLQTLAHGVRPHIAISRKLSLAFVVLALLLGLGIGAGFWSHALSLPASRSVTPAPTVMRSTSKPAPTGTSVSSIYSALAGTYNGTIFDIPANVRTSLTLTNVRESQGKISGYLSVGSGLLGYGPFKGTIDYTTKHLQFTVTDADGNPTLFFEGAMQSATNLSGDYYRCNPAQGSPCVRGPVGYGLWNVVLG